jgi:hypothetical protein
MWGRGPAQCKQIYKKMLMSQLRPRIRPLDSSQLTCFYLIAGTRPSELFMPLFRGCEHTERIYLL